MLINQLSGFYSAEKYRFQKYALPLSTTIPFHRWMDDLQFNILFISISVMLGPWVDDNERLCVMESYWSFRRFRFEQGSNPGRLMSRPTFYPLSYRECHSILVPITSSTLNMVTSVKKEVFTKSTTPV